MALQRARARELTERVRVGAAWSFMSGLGTVFLILRGVHFHGHFNKRSFELSQSREKRGAENLADSFGVQ